MSTQMRNLWEERKLAAKKDWKAKIMCTIVPYKHRKIGRGDLIVRIKRWEMLGYYDRLRINLSVCIDSDLDPDCVKESIAVIWLIKEKSLTGTIPCPRFLCSSVIHKNEGYRRGLLEHCSWLMVCFFFANRTMHCNFRAKHGILWQQSVCSLQGSMEF
jgi:hypothetical protein